MTTEEPRDTLPLPGLEPVERAESALKAATRRTIAALHAAGLVGEQHAMHCQLMLEMADAVAAGVRTGKASAAALGAAQLLAAWDHLPKPEEGDEEDEWTKLGRELRDVAEEVKRDLAR